MSQSYLSNIIENQFTTAPFYVSLMKKAKKNVIRIKTTESQDYLTQLMKYDNSLWSRKPTKLNFNNKVFQNIAEVFKNINRKMKTTSIKAEIENWRM